MRNYRQLANVYAICNMICVFIIIRNVDVICNVELGRCNMESERVHVTCTSSGQCVDVGVMRTCHVDVVRTYHV